MQTSAFSKPWPPPAQLPMREGTMNFAGWSIVMLV
jgi:hypothetical protein